MTPIRHHLSRLHPSPVAFLALLFALLAPGVAGAQKHSDEKHGYELRIPKDFNIVPVNLDEKWVVAKFLYKRALSARKGWEREAPEVRVIVFPKFDPKEFAKRKVEKKGNLWVLQSLQNPYKNYHDYMQQNYRGSGGGWHVEKERDTKIDDLPATYKRIEVNKIMQGEEGISHILHAWEIDYGDATYVIHCQGLADHDKKFRNHFRRCAESFTKIKRLQALKTATTGASSSTTGRTDDGKPLSVEEMYKERKRHLESIRQLAIQKLPDHWKHFEKGKFLVVYNGEVDKRFLMRAVGQANDLWDWLEDEFPDIGKHKAVGGVLRVCNDVNEAAAYVDTSGKSGYSARTREIVIWKDRNYGFDRCRYRLNQGIVMRWLDDKNRRLWAALPPWLDFGLVYYVGALEKKGRKLESRPDEWEMEAIREMMRDDSFKPAKKMFEAKYGDGFRSRKDAAQCVAMVHFLMTKGKRIKKYKTLVQDYLGVLDRRIRELYKDTDKLNEDLVDNARKKGDDGEEERRKWIREWEQKREAIFKECLKECFGDWSERDWSNFEKNWRKSF